MATTPTLCVDREESVAELVARGRVELEDGLLQDALTSFQEAAELAPERPELAHWVGRTLLLLGRIDEAERLYHDLRRRQEGFAAALAGQGAVAFVRRDLDRAEDAFRRAAALEPSLAEAWLGLGEVAAARGAAGQAEEHLRRAMDCPEGRARGAAALGRRAMAARRFTDACELFLEGLRDAPAHILCRCGLAQLIAERRPLPVGAELLRAVARWIDAARVDAQRIAAGCLALIRSAAAVPDLLSLDFGVEALRAAAPRAARELLLSLLRSAVVSDQEVEDAVLSLRRDLLRRFQESASFGSGLEMAVACAHQGHLTQHAADISPDEEALVAERMTALLEELAHGPRQDPERRATLLVLVAMHRGLGEEPLGPALSRIPIESWPAAVRPLLRRQVFEPLEERRIASGLASAGAGVWTPVQEQYEAYPYPCWRTLDRPLPITVGALLRGLFPRSEPAPSLDRPCSILVAGCGTGRHPLSTALRFLHTRVVGIDVSRQSLAYAERMRGELRLKSVTLRQCAIEQLLDCEERFDVIECVGVLHHLESPEEGWRTLVKLLRSGGVMKIGLYSRIARTGVAAAREHLQELSLSRSPADVRRGRAAIRSLPPSHPGRSVAGFSDFYSISGAVDLLFHVREHVFELPEIEDMLERLGLSMLGFEILPPGAREAYRALFPDDRSGNDLFLWHAFEEMYPSTFASMYQFWCTRRADH